MKDAKGHGSNTRGAFGLRSAVPAGARQAPARTPASEQAQSAARAQALSSALAQQFTNQAVASVVRSVAPSPAARSTFGLRNYPTQGDHAARYGFGRVRAAGAALRRFVTPAAPAKSE